MKPRFDYIRHSIVVDDMVIRYWDEGRGQPIMLIHGLGGSAEHWAWTFPYWDHRFRLIAVDLPGFGQSTIPPRIHKTASLTGAAALIEGITRKLKLDKPLLIGHSMGAGIALQHALSFPDSQIGLVLISPMGFGKEIDAISRLLSVPVLGELLFQPRRSVIRQFFKPYKPTDGLDRLAEITYRNLRRPGAKAWHHALIREGVNPFGQTMQFDAQELAHLSLPTLIIWGNNDPLFPIGHAINAMKLIPRARLHILEEVGHNPQIEEPEAVAELAGHFVDALRSKEHVLGLPSVTAL